MASPSVNHTHFATVSSMVTAATNNPIVQAFCKNTGHKVSLVRTTRGWMLRVGGSEWLSRLFGSVSELVGFCAAMNVGFVAGEL